MKYSKFFGLALVALIISGCASKVVESGSDSQATEASPKQEVAESPKDNFVDLSKQEETVVESTMQPIYFGFDKYDVNDDMKPILKANFDYIKYHLEKNDMKKVLLEGNTDEFGSSEYNFALGLKRAIAVRDILLLQGIDKKNIDYISYGKTNPVCTEKTKECYANNRRTDFKNIDDDKELKNGSKIDKRKQ